MDKVKIFQGNLIGKEVDLQQRGCKTPVIDILTLIILRISIITWYWNYWKDFKLRPNVTCKPILERSTNRIRQAHHRIGYGLGGCWGWATCRWRGRRGRWSIISRSAFIVFWLDQDIQGWEEKFTCKIFGQAYKKTISQICTGFKRMNNYKEILGF